MLKQQNLFFTLFRKISNKHEWNSQSRPSWKHIRHRCSLFLTHVPVCVPSGLLWIPCHPSLVDPSLHRASPALTLQTVRRTMWLWWVLVSGGETARCSLCFNELCHLNTPCVSETTLSSLAEPSVYLPSCEWHQQPSPQKMWQRGLSCTGLPAWITQPT